MAPPTKKATGTAVVTALVALSVAPSIHGAPTSGGGGAAAAAAAAAAPPPSLGAASVAAAEVGPPPRRLTAEALAALDAATRQEATPVPVGASTASSLASSAESEAESEEESAASEAASEAASDAESAASDAESAAESAQDDLTATPTAATLGDDADSDAGSDDGVVADCFPADATAETADGRVVAMADLAVGDVVRVAAGDTPAAFSPVFLFTHKLPTPPRSFVRLTTAGGARLDASAGHYVYANGRLVAAAAVAVGDTLQVATPTGWAASPVTASRRVKAGGLYNPQTLHGDIVVGGVRASTYTTAVAPGVASALLAPLRAVYRTTGRSMTALEGGGGRSRRSCRVARRCAERGGGRDGARCAWAVESWWTGGGVGRGGRGGGGDGWLAVPRSASNARDEWGVEVGGC